MIHSVEDKNKKELIEIVEIQVQEYRDLVRKYEELQDEIERLQGIGHEENIKGDALSEVLKMYREYVRTNTGFGTMTFEDFVRFQAKEYYLKVDELLGVEYTEDYFNPIRS